MEDQVASAAMNVAANPEAMRELGMGIAKAAALLGAGLCMGMGAIGPALGECYAAAKAIEGMAKVPEHNNMLFRNMLIAMALGETTAIYSLVISLLLIFAL